MRLIDAEAFERRCMFDAEINDMQDVMYALRDFPTIESRPKGKWLDNPPDSWICSNCGTHYEERLTFKAHNYCCVCGADMR